MNNNNICSSNFRKSKFISILFVLFFVISSFTLDVRAQGVVSAGNAPGSSPNSYSIGDLDSVNLFSGNVSFKLPLPFQGARGTAKLPLYYDLAPIPWSVETEASETVTGDFEYTHLPVQKPRFSGRFSTAVVYASQTDRGTMDCYGHARPSSSLTVIYLLTSDGNQIEFRDVDRNGQYIDPACGSGNRNRGTKFKSYDSTSAYFVSDSNVFDSPWQWGPWPMDSSFGPRFPYYENQYYVSGTLHLSDGSTYRFEVGILKWIRDRNGNLTTYENTVDGLSVTDSAERKIIYSKTEGTRPEDLIETISYKGTGGSNRGITIHHARLTDVLRSDSTLERMDSLFPVLYANNYNCLCGGENLNNPVVISKVILPNNQEYNFKYDSYGEIARVEYPNGRVVEYDWRGGIEGGNESGDHVNRDWARIYRRVVEKRTYSDGITLDNKLVFSRVPDEHSQSSVQIDVDLFDSGGLVSKARHHFYGHPLTESESWKQGKEFRSEIFDSNGITLLRKKETTWTQTPFFGHTTWPDQSPPNNPHITETTTLLADSNQVSKKVFAYDGNNNLTDTWEYDFGIGTPGTFLRRTHTDFLTTNPVNNLSYTSDSIHILGLPSQKWISADINGQNIVSRVKYEYDNYSSDQTHASLMDRPNITGHDSNYSTGFMPRGNLTKVTSYADAQNQTGDVSSYTQFDIAGNAIKSINANGKVNLVDYSDRFGSPDAEARSNNAPSALAGKETFAYPTKATNPLGFTSYVQVDYFTGAVVDNENLNGNVTSTFYNDILDRPTQTIYCSNRPSFKKQTTIVYDDQNRKVTITSDSKVYNDNLLKSETFYDKAGRTIESRQYEIGSNYITSLTEYDSLGRVYKSSNPFREYLSETPKWATTEFDSLGRVVWIKTADNSIAYRSYSGSTTTVTDQASRKRTGVSDALGRVLKVIEDPDGLHYETDYMYDVVGRLRKTTQTENQITQNRYFLYNDLGRLIRAKQPEQIANSNFPQLTDPVTGNSSWSVSYSYDDVGNLVSTTDANNRSITGTYDDLNRLIHRDYSEPSMPDVTFTFDDPNIANSKGQLTAVTSSISTTLYTSFDEIGHITSSQQITNGETYNFPNYTYDLLGAMVEETYPSGRVVSIETDELGRLSGVKGQILNHAERTYLSNLSYGSTGAVEKARLGNGLWESAQFDAERGQLIQIGLGASSGDSSYLKIDYEYGYLNQGTGEVQPGTNNGALGKQIITFSGLGQSSGLTAMQNYAYDSLNRLQIATEIVFPQGQPTQVGWRQQFLYDRFGNRRFDAANTTTLPQDNGTFNPHVDEGSNRFTVAEGYNYDNEGNLTSNPENQLFTYDSENRQVQVQNTVSGQASSYFYDGNGKRVRKIVGDQETVFVYDAAGALVAEYTTNQPITNEGTKYLTADALGSPRAVSDIGGTVTSRHDYMPFGEEVFAGTGGRTSAQGYLVNNDGIRKQFTGYERDDESGLDYAQARYFNPRHGRFTSVDPMTASAEVKNPQTLNRYSYGLNSPYKFVDPLGLRGSDLSCFGNTSGGGANSIGSCEAERSLAFYEERLQNTMDTIAINRAVANGDQATAGSICASNSNITCQREETTVTILEENCCEEGSPVEKMIDLLKNMEGVPGSQGAPALTSYDKDGANGGGNCTIGWGHLLNSGPCKGSNIGLKWDIETALLYLGFDLDETYRNVAKEINFNVLSEQQSAAVILLAFNLPGKSLKIAPNLKAALKNPNLANRDAIIRKEWSSIKYSKGKEVPGLVNRRKAELDVFFNGTYRMW